MYLVVLALSFQDFSKLLTDTPSDDSQSTQEDSGSLDARNLFDFYDAASIQEIIGDHNNGSNLEDNDDDSFELPSQVYEFF